VLLIVKKKVLRDVTSMAVKDQHAPLTLKLRKRVVMEVDKIFYSKAFVRVTRRGISKKGLVFEVVFKVFFEQDVALKDKHRRDSRAIYAHSFDRSKRLLIVRISKVDVLSR